MRIHALPPQLINQIAAGEVVERPASVVKELLENSLDAGARQLDIDIVGGGVRQIRVRDDGGGIDREDLALALSRHATSKIQNLHDLERVATMGFRGEALPSIASVSRLTLTSQAEDADHAWSLQGEPGEGEAPQPAAHPRGTTVDVRDLFYNVPARRKFLRTEKTEFGHLETVVKRIALGRFDVGFRLGHNRREVLHLPAAEDDVGAAGRVAAVCGAPFLEQSLLVDHAAAGLRLRGWIGLPTFSRSQADLQYFYVNGRFVRDKLVTHGVRQAYTDVLYHGRHPAYVLYLDLDPALVDVNVHPTKHEVRFREGRLVHDFLFRGLHHILGETKAGEAAPVPLRAAPAQTDALLAHQAPIRPHTPILSPMPRETRPLPLHVEEQRNAYASFRSSVAAAPTPMPATPTAAGVPTSAMPILIAQPSGAPAAPAAPLSSSLSFLARLADITKA